jgi:N-acetyl-anhydromuramyl-L-alanine amidase AmpD
MNKVNGIVVHQTGVTTIGSTWNSYQGKGANGAHFLIDKDGTIYQTASIAKRTNHVGKLQSRCLVKKICSPEEFKSSYAIRNKYTQLSNREYQKPFPERFPSNTDSIGIEIVGGVASGEGENAVYERVTSQQNASLQWLIRELANTLQVSMAEIYRHPDVSYKTKTEAQTAKWN